MSSIQDYLVGESWINRKYFGGCWLLFLLLHFLEERWLGLGMVVLCHSCDRSLLFGCHLLSLAFLEGGVAGFVLGLGVLDEKRLGVFSLFSVMLMDTPGFGRAAVL